MVQEEVEFKVGDILTLYGGNTLILDTFRILEDMTNKGFDSICDYEDIEKVERYIQDGLYEGHTEAYMTYRLQTIWEKQNKKNTIEELGMIYRGDEAEEIMRNRFKINELIKEVNKLKANK